MKRGCRNRGLMLCLGAVLAGGGCDASFTRGGTDETDAGAALIEKYRCGSCHRIPGIRTARGLVGPPLDNFGRRSFIAGRIPNTEENLVRWIRDPRTVDDRTAMPYLGVSNAEAQLIAAYLHTLH